MDGRVIHRSFSIVAAVRKNDLSGNNGALAWCLNP